MIIKFYELIKIDKNKFNIFLLYGKNEGLQNQTLKENFIINFKGEVIKYDEQEFIVNYENIASEILTKSLFEDEKLIIVSRVSDKILRYIEELSDKKITDLKIVLKSSQLDKKSKLRSFFEKSKRLVVTPFYEDTDKSLAYEIEKFINQSDLFSKSGNTFLTIKVEQFAASSIDLRLICFTKTSKYLEWMKVKDLLALEIKNIVEKNNASFAFPSTSVYVEKN